MVTLEKRLKLKQEAAEAITDPSFVALTSLERLAEGNGYMPIKAKISHLGRTEDNSHTLKMTLSRRDDDETLDYRIIYNGLTYEGTVELAEENDEIVTKVNIHKVNTHSVKDRNGKLVYGSKVGKQFELTADQVKKINYWVPTIIKHFAMNADNFILLHESNEGGVVEDPKSSNRYWFDYATNTYHAEGDGHKFEMRASPEPHYRHGYSRKKTVTDDSGRERKIDVPVSGTFVRTDWSKYSTERVLELVAARASDIKPEHFEQHLLPVISKHHNLDAVLNAYRTGQRTQKALEPAA